MKKTGRPSKPGKLEIQKAICDTVATSNKSIRSILMELSKKMDGVPPSSSVNEWLKTDRDFAESYRIAKEMQSDYLAEQLLEIADDESLDMVFDDKGKPSVDKEHITRSKLRVDARKWLLMRLRPSKPPEAKFSVEHSFSETNLASLIAVVRQEFRKEREK